jgi:hypothetical protein
LYRENGRTQYNNKRCRNTRDGLDYDDDTRPEGRRLQVPSPLLEKNRRIPKKLKATVIKENNNKGNNNNERSSLFTTLPVPVLLIILNHLGTHNHDEDPMNISAVSKQFHRECKGSGID